MGKCETMFREVLKSNVTPVTYEIWSPKGCVINQHIKDIKDFKDRIDAVNVPDNPLSTLKVSSIAYAKIVMDELKVDAIPHLNCRDRNLLALQSDILGAHILGLRNLFIIGGDKPSGILKPKEVWETTSIELCRIVKGLNKGFAYNDESIKIEGKTDFLVGGTIIFDRKNEVETVSKKIEAGFDFFQSQITFNPNLVLNFFEKAEKQGVNLDKPVLIGLAPQPSEKALKKVLSFLHVEVSENLLKRLRRSGDFQGELISVLLEAADEIKSALSPKYKIGFHIMTLGCDYLGKKIIEGLRRK